MKVCLIGAGRAGMIHGHNFVGRVPGGTMTAVCDPAGDAAKSRRGAWNCSLLQRLQTGNGEP